VWPLGSLVVAPCRLNIGSVDTIHLYSRGCRETLILDLLFVNTPPRIPRNEESLVDFDIRIFWVEGSDPGYEVRRPSRVVVKVVV
jgi:hypothetical protein